MRPTCLRIVTVVVMMNLAAYGQAAAGQASGAQASPAPASAARASSTSVPSGQASAAAASSGPASSGQGSVGQASNGQTPSGQSLGDLARSLREKQTSTPTAPATPAKVITNQDLGEGPEGRPDLREEPRPASFNRGYAQPPGQQRAEQWRNQILEQKNRIADTQARIDRINGSLHSGAQFEGAYSHDQALRVERVEQLQTQLDEQKRRLERMQDAARRAGMPSQTYDP